MSGIQLETEITSSKINNKIKTRQTNPGVMPQLKPPPRRLLTKKIKLALITTIWELPIQLKRSQKSLRKPYWPFIMTDLRPKEGQGIYAMKWSTHGGLRVTTKSQFSTLLRKIDLQIEPN